MAKFVGKFRQNRNYMDDGDYSKDFSKNKKRKKDEYREMRKMKMQNQEEDGHSYDDYETPKRMSSY